MARNDREEAGGVKRLRRAIRALGAHTVGHVMVHFIDPVEQMVLLGNADNPEAGIGWLVEGPKYWCATRHCQTEHQQKDQRQPPDTIEAGVWRRASGWASHRRNHWVSARKKSTDVPSKPRLTGSGRVRRMPR